MRVDQAIDRYVERKRSDGVTLVRCVQTLQSLERQVGHLALERVTARHIALFLQGPKTSPVTWEHKYHLLHRFFDFWVARGEIEILPLPIKRKSSPRNFIPHIYTHAEISTLLRTTRISQRNADCRIDAVTLRTLIVFLYGTGALVGETCRLCLKDVDLKKGSVTFREGGFNRSRSIPVAPELKSFLGRYLCKRLKQKTDDTHLFVNKSGDALNRNTLMTTFKRLRRRSAILPHDGSRLAPRMHDLRHTFAVHRITTWLRHGADLNRMLPALAVYMGQVGLGSTERYLSLTPERFRTQLDKLSPERGRRHWRDNSALMKFLAEL